MATNNESPDEAIESLDSFRGALEGEGWCVARIALTAVMAAVLESGDRARVVPDGDYQFDPRASEYVNRATELLNAAEEKENERLDAVLEDGGL